MSAAYAATRTALCAHCGAAITRYGQSGNPLAYWRHDASADTRCDPEDPRRTTWAGEARRPWR